MTAGHRDGPTRRYHSRSGDHAELDGPGYIYGEAVGGTNVPDGRDAGPEVQGGIGGATKGGEGARLALDHRVGLGGGAPYKVDVGVYEAWQQRCVAEIDDLDAGGESVGGSNRDDVPTFNYDRALLDEPLRDTVEDTSRPVAYSQVAPLRWFGPSCALRTGLVLDPDRSTPPFTAVTGAVGARTSGRSRPSIVYAPSLGHYLRSAAPRYASASRAPSATWASTAPAILPWFISRKRG